MRPSALWPFPVDPEQVVDAGEDVRAVRDAALREVGIVPAQVLDDGTRVWGPTDWDHLMRAQRVAFLSLRIDFDDVTQDEYAARYRCFVSSLSPRKSALIGTASWRAA